MSCNYYWRFAPAHVPNEVVTVWGSKIAVTIDWLDPALHIGRSANMLFMWASDPGPSRAYFETHPNEVVALDENGETYTGAEMLQLVKSLASETGSVGKRFS